MGLLDKGILGLPFCWLAPSRGFAEKNGHALEISRIDGYENVFSFV